MSAFERNRERHTDFDIRWRWAQGARTPGFTAVMRVRNEARNLPWVLPGLFRAVEQVILIDNRSTDATADVAQRIAKELGADDRLQVMAYPFPVARCGTEHLHTPADSVHSLTYFYNWSFSQVATTYALKWDGDMVLTREGEHVLRDLSWQLEATETVLPIPRTPIYVESADRAYVDIGLAHHEPCGWPNTGAYRFAKGFEWEVPIRPADATLRVFPTLICFEVKWLDADEFSNWTGREFEGSERTVRKQRDWAIHRDLNRGLVPRNLLAISRGAAPHVLDAVRDAGRSQWQALIDSRRADATPAEQPVPTASRGGRRRISRWWTTGRGVRPRR